MVRGFKANANRIALEIRKAMGLAPHSPLDPVAVCRHFEIDLIPLSSLGAGASHFLFKEREAFSALTVPCGMKRAIVHNDSHAPTRQKSNIFHELAHGFLGHAPCATFECNGERQYDSGIEAEAGFLTGTLMITNEAAWHIVRNNLTRVAGRLYGASQKMLNYRLSVSGAMKRAARAQQRYP